jgi:effector-binding domain-containing protein
MQYRVRTTSFYGSPLAVVRRRASRAELSKVVPEACGAVWKTLRNENVTGLGRNVAVYLDCEMNIEVGVELESPYVSVNDGEVIASALPAGNVATTTHFGPYSKLGEAHDAVQAWVQSNGLQLAGLCWETYGHWKDEWNRDPSKIRTEVFYLLTTPTSP